MIAYFDTSALVPLVVREPSSQLCGSIWDASTRVLAVRLVYPEARAALARAHRMTRLTSGRLRSAVSLLDELADQIDVIEIDTELARSAGHLAERHSLRAYDAVHLASAMKADSDEFVFVTGDAQLAHAARHTGLAVAFTA